MQEVIPSENKIIINGTFSDSYVISDDPVNPEDDYNPSSFVGLLKDASDPDYYPFYESGLKFLRQAFDPAYIEFLFPPERAGVLPNPWWENKVCESNEQDLKDRLKAFSEKWYLNKGKSNYIHLMGANKECLENDTTSGSTISWSLANPHINLSYIYSGLIIANRQGNEINSIATTTVHELAHHFLYDLECGDHPGPGHCTNNAFEPPDDQEPCLMQEYLQNPANSIVRFCLQHIMTDQNACFSSSIRREKDDL